MNKLFLFVCCAAVVTFLGCGQVAPENGNKPAENRPANATKPEAVTENSSMDLFQEGTKAYFAKDFKKATEIYRKALDLEKKDPKLEKKWWFVLIDNLSMAYGISGDIKNSREVIEYGISKEPTYPLFYYNNACGYGEENNEAKAIENLRLAYKYKGNMLEGETIPEPTTDSSFKNLMKSDSFKKAVENMKSGK